MPLTLQPPPPELDAPPIHGSLKKWPFPEGSSLVAQSEDRVRLLAEKMVRDSKLLTLMALGPEGRPFGHVKLSEEEQHERYLMLKEQGATQGWLEQLQQSDKPIKVVRQWIKREQALKQEEENG